MEQEINRMTAMEHVKNPLKYLATSTIGALVSLHYHFLIQRSIDGEIPYEPYWGTVGTDYFGIIGQIALAQFTVRIAQNTMRMTQENDLDNLVNYALPFGWATFHTVLESLDLIGIENMDTNGGFDPLDIACYWGGAITMSLLAKLYDRKKTHQNYEINV